jgi:hypothetical protein
MPASVIFAHTSKQALYELQRGDEVLPLVLRLYPVGPIPFAVAHLTGQLLVHRWF